MPKYGDTTNESVPSLCETCEHATQIKGDRLNDRLTLCDLVHPARMMPFLVRECSGWTEKGGMDLYQMRQAAWIMTIDKRDRSNVGFRAPTRRHGLPSNAPEDDE